MFKFDFEDIVRVVKLENIKGYVNKDEYLGMTGLITTEMYEHELYGNLYEVYFEGEVAVTDCFGKLWFFESELQYVDSLSKYY